MKIRGFPSKEAGDSGERIPTVTLFTLNFQPFVQGRLINVCVALVASQPIPYRGYVPCLHFFDYILCRFRVLF